MFSMNLKRIGLATLAVVVALVIWSFQPTQYPRFQTQPGVKPEGGHHVLIFGATRNTGLEVARILVARGDRVTAFVRPSSNRSDLEKLGVGFLEGDALDMESVQAAFGDEGYTAVLTTIACFTCDPKPDYLGNRNIFDAAVEANIKRMLLVTTVGAGDSYDSAPLPARIFLKDMLPLKTMAEDHLMSSGLAYTIIRPGGLKSEPRTGSGYLSESRETIGIINRADLADLIVEALDDERTIGKVLAAVDAEMVFPWDMF